MSELIARTNEPARTAIWADAHNMTPRQLTTLFVLVPEERTHWASGKTAAELTDHEVVKMINSNLAWLAKGGTAQQRIELTLRALCWEAAVRGIRVEPMDGTAHGTAPEVIHSSTMEAHAEALRLAGVHAERVLTQVRAGADAFRSIMAQLRNGEG